MELLNIALFLEISLLAFSIQPGECIRCYVCNSAINPKCADPIERSGLEPMECTKTAFQEVSSTVRKGVETLGDLLGFQGIPEGPNIDLKFACQKIDMSDQTGTKHTFRSCSIAKSESVDPCAMADDVSKITKGQGKVDFCETCEKDLCNHSVRHSFTLTSVIVVPCFAIIISSWIGV
ncbi:uncharacterized protein LOC110831103 [Zootermopsis nevadensis]|uniref:Uncharacterized protein n=1 Tax=Zootermopsis nevadensis TaxID=136037 RepID=A0A067R6Z0_ZOONE|nr:uncharacterized protein LOC110831103 [Zootermopsis nevadensis]KDR18173.1 hypothetical protein L798_06923 [Zootermopsis nevadensis]